MVNLCCGPGLIGLLVQFITDTNYYSVYLNPPPTPSTSLPASIPYMSDLWSFQSLKKPQQFQLAISYVCVHWKPMNSYISSETFGQLQSIMEKVGWTEQLKLLFFEILHCNLDHFLNVCHILLLCLYYHIAQNSGGVNFWQMKFEDAFGWQYFDSCM